jgi:hypothetical protein
MQDTLALQTNSMRSSVASLKKKLSNLKISVETLDAELEKIDTKFDKLLTESELYKQRLERNLGREVRRLERELALLQKQAGPESSQPTVSAETLRITSTVAILESILREITQGSEDFKLISYSFLFPAVIERVVTGEEEAYFLDEVPASASLVIERGRQYVAWTRESCDVHLIDPEAWESHCEEIANWWRNDALPLLYGSRDEQWDIDVPLSHMEMMLWRDNPGDRPIHFSKIFDAYEIYRNNKDAVYETSGLRQFELKSFAFNAK